MKMVSKDEDPLRKVLQEYKIYFNEEAKKKKEWKCSEKNKHSIPKSSMALIFVRSTTLISIWITF